MINNVWNWIFCYWISKKINEKITNLIHHEFIKGSRLFNRKFMQRSNCYIFGLPNMPLLQKIVSNHWLCHKTYTNLFLLFIYIWHFACIMFCKHSYILIQFCWSLILWNNKMSNVSFFFNKYLQIYFFNHYFITFYVLNYIFKLCIIFFESCLNSFTNM
jgi:hypothetical protein